MSNKQSGGIHTNGLAVLEVLRGSRRPLDETYAADFENLCAQDGEPNSGSNVSSETDSDWAVSGSEDDSDSRQHSSIQAGAGFAELDMLLSKRPIKEVPQLLYSLKLTITSLYKLPIRRPAPAERLDRLAKASSNQFSYYEDRDIMHVQDKFNQADKKLVRRLGRMNTRRRQLLRYRQAHEERLKRDRGDSHDLLLDTESIQDSRATTFKPPTYHFYSEDTKNSEVQSLPDSLSSLASTETGEELLAFPSPPKGPNGEDLEAFICPYCCVPCHITSSHGWERHVKCDLEPYVCTFANCVRTNDMFQSREDWYNHEIQQHRFDYSCNVKDHEQYSDIREFLSHMDKEHNVQIDEEQSKSQLSMFSRPTQRKSGICPLCMKSTKRLKVHLARHLEQIALFILPRQSDTAIDSSGENTSEENVANVRIREAFLDDGSSSNNDDDQKMSLFSTESVMGIQMNRHPLPLLAQNGVDPSTLSDEQITAFEQEMKNAPNAKYFDILLLLIKNGIDPSMLMRHHIADLSEQSSNVLQKALHAYKQNNIPKMGNSSYLENPRLFYEEVLGPAMIGLYCIRRD